MWSATITARAAFTASRISALGKLRKWTQWTTHQLGEQLPGLGSVLGNIQDHVDLTNEDDINIETLHTMALKVSQRTLSRRACRVLANRYFNPRQATAGPQPSFCHAEVQGQVGAFTLPPRTTRAEMDDKTFFFAAARLRIVIPKGDHVTRCHKIYDDTLCAAELDETQTHALICQFQGSTVHRHNRIRDTIAHILRESGQYNDVQVEQLARSIRCLRCATNEHHCSRTTGPTRSH